MHEAQVILFRMGILRELSQKPECFNVNGNIEAPWDCLQISLES
jgi:hypothetical protein